MGRKLLLGGAITAVVVVILGSVLLVTGIERLSETRLEETRTSAPGEREVSLEAQKYVIYYEVDQSLAPANEGGALADPLFDISVRDGDGSPLDIDDYLVNFDVASGGRYAQAIRTVEPPVSGDYRLTVEGEEDSGDPSVVLGKPVTGRLTPLLAGVVALLVGLGTGLFVAIAALLGRRLTKSA